MAKIVFGSGVSVDVPGGKDQWQQHLSVEGSGAVDGGLKSVITTDGKGAVINPRQVAYIIDDEEMPQAESGPSPFFTDQARDAGGFQ